MRDKRDFTDELVKAGFPAASLCIRGDGSVAILENGVWRDPLPAEIVTINQCRAKVTKDEPDSMAEVHKSIKMKKEAPHAD